MRNIRNDFPIFQKEPQLVYLDSAASALKPQTVIDKLVEYYTEYSTNVHRGLYPMAEKATAEYERARQAVADFLNSDVAEIVFTRSATEAINLVAYSFARNFLKKSQSIVVTELEHHSNIVPWYLISTEKHFPLIWWPVEDNGSLNPGVLAGILKQQNVGLVAVTGMSNVLGTKPDLSRIVNIAHKAGAKVLVDAAQLAVHGSIDVKELGVDFLALTGHKLYGPTGIGVLYGKAELLQDMPPFEGGGEMIREVKKEEVTFKDIPHRFEAGTPPIAEAIGLGAAIQYLEGLGRSKLSEDEEEMTRYALERLSSVPGLTILGPQKRGPLVAFTLEGIHAHDIATILGQEGVAIRGGHHCTMPLHAKLGIPASARASFGVYTSKEDIDRLVAGLKKVQERFSHARAKA